MERDTKLEVAVRAAKLLMYSLSLLLAYGMLRLGLWLMPEMRLAIYAITLWYVFRSTQLLFGLRGT